MATAEFRIACAYEQDAATVHRVVTDPDFLAAKLRAGGGRDVEVVRASASEVETRRTIATDLPAFARAVLGETTRLTQVERWEEAGPAGHRGTFSVRGSNTPVTIDGTSEIVPDAAGTGCQVLINGTVRARVPVVGGRVAALVARRTEEAIEAERAFTADWIKNR
jgi:hypothetical protein